MKTNHSKAGTILVVICSIALPVFAFLGVARIHAAPAVHGTVPVASHQAAPHSVTNDLVDLPASSAIEMPEKVIVGSVPQKTWTLPKSPAKTWTCSAPRALVQGPVAQTVRDCEWR